MPIDRLRPSFTFTEDRLDQLRAVVPEAFADGEVDWDALREALGNYLEDDTEPTEHFGLTWPGKRQARRAAASPSHGTLVPCPGDGVDEATTRNIFIEGENLEVLKLLQKSYAGRVKMIYIDPPYNTGNDFIYVDDYAESVESYLRRTRQTGEGGELLTTNPKTGGRFHSNWLNMMYPRLVIARSLLDETGMIVISIDDNEVDHLRMLVAEVFGDENFIAQVTVQSNPRGRQSKALLAPVHEYLLLFAKSADDCVVQGKPLTPDQIAEFKYSDSNAQRYRLLGLRQRGSAWRRADRPNMFYPIYVCPEDARVSLERSDEFTDEVLPRRPTGEDSRWMWSASRVARDIDRIEAHLVSGRGQWDIFVRDYLTTDGDVDRTRKIKTIWQEAELNYQNGTQEVKELFQGVDIMPYPKPMSLMNRILQMSQSDDDEVVMDFFAGSCPMAQSVLELTGQVEGRRCRFIMVQLPEPTGRSDFPTIAEIGKERIRRVISRITAEGQPSLAPAQSLPPDLGFRSYRLARSHFRRWRDYTGDSIVDVQTLFDQFESPLVDGWKPEDLLVEVMLQEGFPLDSTVSAWATASANVVQVVTSDACVHRLWVCLDPELVDETVEGLALAAEDVFVCLDTAVTDQQRMRLADRFSVKVI